ncbi:MAG: ribosome silencing factor [Oscillospiraceae bacterium]|jgi:ribosome-associated protein|nr:ribosome silencing factor [Oscillospiraceae bacterium]
MESSTLELVKMIVSHLDDRKAEDVIALDVAHMTVLAEAFVIASGRSALQVRALYESLTEKLDETGAAPRRKEGISEGRWIVIDYGNVIVHLFHEQERAYYNLERLWTDGSNKIVINL